MARPPRLNSSVSWNPAVPPPPVAGAAVGKGLGDGLGVGEAEWLCVADGLAEGVSVGLAEGLELAVPLAVAVAVAVAGPVLVGEPPGEMDGGVAEGELPEHAETDMEASTVTVAQAMALNLPLSRVPVMVERILMGPPHASADARPVPGSGIRKNHPGRKIARTAQAQPGPGRSQKSPPARKVTPAGLAGRQWLVHHWDIRLRE
jgi:hypothetical protein